MYLQFQTIRELSLLQYHVYIMTEKKKETQKRHTKRQKGTRAAYSKDNTKAVQSDQKDKRK